MADILLRDLDPEDFRKQIAAEVAAQVAKVLEEKQRPRLVDRIEMAELAGIGTATLDNLVSAEVIPSVMIGRRRLFDPGAVIEALKQK